MLAYGGGSVKKTGVYDQIMGLLKKANKRVVELSGIPANPTYRNLAKKAGNCVQRGHCNSRCPFHVDQMARMEKIKEYFAE